jgi:hypothetical protein
MTHQVFSETWGSPKFNFGDQVSLQSLPDPRMWFGVVTGIEYALAAKIWNYTVFIFNHSYLLQECEHPQIFVTWHEANMILVE